MHWSVSFILIFFQKAVSSHPSVHKFEMKIDELCALGVLEGYFVNVLPVN